MSWFSSVTGLDRLKNNVLKGYGYERDFQRVLVWAVKHGNEAALKDCAAVGQQWLAEATDELGNIKKNVVEKDPFQVSRHMVQALTAKYPTK